MKARESGMPEEKTWNRFFNVDNILTELEINGEIHCLVELGFGYGTFTISASKTINGVVHAFDLETSLYNDLKSKLSADKINNVSLHNRDFISNGSGLKNDYADYVMLFNILHAEESVEILNESYRILKPNGKLGIIHWNYDSNTPRGPSMSIRPKPEYLRDLLIQEGFEIVKFNINLPPYHYGILARK